MTRRRLRLLLLGIVLTIPWLMGAAAEAQRTGPVRIGALTESWGPTTLIVGLRNGLLALGYREDRDFTIGVRFTQGNPAELPSAARDLVRLGVDLIVAGETSAAARAAQMASDRIPIIFVGGGDPVEAGLVKSFAHPGGNITGIADLDVEVAPKRMEISATWSRVSDGSCSPTTRRIRSPPPSCACTVTPRAGSASRW